MVVATRQQLRRNLTASARKSVFENRRHGAVQKTIAVLLPEPIEGPEAGRVEATVCTHEPRGIVRPRSFLHAPLLIEEPAQFIDVIKPKVIVALGTFATRALLRTLDPISRLRGRIFEYRGAKLIPTFHPAYLLRNPGSKREVWEDIKLVRSLLSS